MNSSIKTDLIQLVKKADLLKNNGINIRQPLKYRRIKTEICKDYVKYCVPLGKANKDETSNEQTKQMETLKKLVESQGKNELKFIGTDSETNSLCFSVPFKSFSQSILQNIFDDPKHAWNKNYLLSGLKKEKIIVEYSSPNLAKPFHMGHLRSTVIGNFVANIHENVGNRVVRMNYIGDWGTQYGLLGLGFSRFGSEEELKQNAIHHLLEVYIKINSLAETDDTILNEGKNFFARMEKGDETMLHQWKQFREFSFADLGRMYKRLGITFDEYQAESMFAEKALDLIKTYYQNGIVSVENNAMVMEIPLHNRLCKIILQKSDGSTIYLSRDLAAAIDRKEKHDFDQMFYVVDNSQCVHFVTLKEVLKKFNIPWFRNIHHVNFGRILKFSSRKGNAVLLEDFLDEAKERMLEELKNSKNTKSTSNWEEVADVEANSILLINDMQIKRQLDYEFSWSKMLKPENNLGSQLQYTHARLCSLFRRFDQNENTYNYDVINLTENEAIKLIHCLSRYDDAIAYAYEELQPYVIVRYLGSLRRAINSAWNKLPVRDQNYNVAQARLALFHCAKTVLNDGLRVLGIIPLNKM